MLNNKNYAIMQKVILVSYDEVTKEFQVVQSYTAVCTDMYSASHFLTLTTDRCAQRGNKVNNVKIKTVNVFNNNA